MDTNKCINLTDTNNIKIIIIAPTHVSSEKEYSNKNYKGANFKKTLK
jgi:hypothetical protein